MGILLMVDLLAEVRCYTPKLFLFGLSSFFIIAEKACLDGALHMWQSNSNFARPNLTIEGAHTKNSETGSLVFSVDGRTVLTRGGDDSVKSKCVVMAADGVDGHEFSGSMGSTCVQEASGGADGYSDAVSEHECGLQPRRQVCYHWSKCNGQEWTWQAAVPSKK